VAVLVLTQQFDPTADLVVAELAGRGVEVFRADTGEFPHRLRLSARLDTGWAGSLVTDWRTVALEDITAVYFRRPSHFQLDRAMSDDEWWWASEEARFGLGGVLAALDCRWISHPEAIATAEYKPLQLAAARRAGLAVPRTLITNDPAQARRFVAGLPDGAVYKALSGAPGALSLPTTRVRAADLDAGVGATAHLFQEWIIKDYEVRLTVVGHRMFAVRIDATSPAARTDFRSDYANLAYSVVDIPRQVQAGVAALMRRFGLAYAAVDLLVSGGRHYFIDLNPNGQWAFVARPTRLPIAAAIADELLGKEGS
jgi:ATP-grasp ribosomal peptide maturase